MRSHSSNNKSKENANAKNHTPSGKPFLTDVGGMYIPISID